MYYFFHVDIAEQEPLTLTFRLPDLNRALEMVQDRQRTYQRFECQYYYETGNLVASHGDGSMMIEAPLGIVPNSPEYDQRLRDAACVVIQNRLERIATERREADRSADYRTAWQAYQALGRSDRHQIELGDWMAHTVSNQVRVEETHEPGTYSASRTIEPQNVSFTMNYDPEQHESIPPEVIDRTARRMQREAELGMLYSVNPAPGSDPAPSRETPGYTASYRTNAFIAREAAGPSPTSNRPRSTTGRASRQKRRHYLTLVPYINFTKCAKCFNDRDLKLMRVSALRCLRRLNNTQLTTEMQRQVSLWDGYEQALVRYGLAMATEIRRRGYADTSYDVFKAKLTPGICAKPDWIKWKRLRNSHQAYLLLREERRQVAKALIKWGRGQRRRGRPMLLSDTCQHLGMDQRRNWQHYSLSDLRHSFNNCSENGTVLPPVNSLYAALEGWTVTPDENFVYPENLA